MTATNATTVTEIPTEHRRIALTLLFQQLSLTERASRIEQNLADADRLPDHLNHLLGVYRNEQLVSVAWAQCMRGRTAILWGPAHLGHDVTHDEMLLAALLARLRAAGTQMAQKIFEEHESPLNPALSKLGFLEPIQLLYLISTRLSEVPSTSRVSFRAFVPSDEPRLGELIELTYLGSRDVPQLNGVRGMEDILEGYRWTGVHDPNRWYFVQFDDEDVGVLLLTDHPTMHYLELVYMGLIPSARGYGFGDELVAYAVGQVQRGGRRHMILAVDAENTPARKIYQRAGFVPLQQRQVSIKILS